MGRQNFAAGLEMTIGSVVRNYLRWFELNRYKKALRSPEYKSTWLRTLFSRRAATAPSGALVASGESMKSHSREAAANNTQSIDCVDPLA
jgi:hypothetical protein